jgi:hypothetical protein
VEVYSNGRPGTHTHQGNPAWMSYLSLSWLAGAWSILLPGRRLERLARPDGSQKQKAGQGPGQLREVFNLCRDE